MAIDSARIAKNTFFLFIRYLFILGITFYVSRVLLDKLGVDDFGLYNAVYGIIGIVSFINGTLSTSTSRFITFELGRGDELTLRGTFSTSLFAHIILSGIIAFLALTVGLWYVYNVLVVPDGRFTTALVIYLFSIVATIISIIQVPFTASIMAHERMNAYAYIGIFDAIARLLAAYSITVCSSDKLITYCLALLCANLLVFVLYVSYSKHHFREINFRFSYDKTTLIEMLKFSGWNVLANFSNTIIIQGVILLYNVFFAPVVVAAQAIGNQISNGIAMLVQNVRSAVTPQITKLFAEGSEKMSEKLTLVSAEYIFYLLMLVGFPCILVMPTLLGLWLKEVPDYTVIFARFLVFQLLLENFNNAYYTPLLAANKISINSILEAIVCVVQFAVLYFLFSSGYGPIWARYAGVVIVVFFSFVEKPLLLWKYLNYDFKSIAGSLLRCIIALLIAMVLNFFIYRLMPQSNLLDSFYVIVLSALSVVITSTIVAGRNLIGVIRTILRK